LRPYANLSKSLRVTLLILLLAFFAHAPDRVRSYAWGRRLPPCKPPTAPENTP